MLRLWLACSVFLAVDPSEKAVPSADDLRAYEQARAKLGRDADAHVQLALWCEARGLESERLKQLTTAVLIDPNHAAARGLLGQVKDGGTWRKTQALTERAKADEELGRRLVEYRERRAKMPDSADGHWQLARWCEQNGLGDEARAHDWNVVRIDPKRSAAWEKLGYKKIGRVWKSDEQTAADKAEADAQAKADHKWKPLFKTWKSWLGSKDRRDEARARLAEVSDPRAVKAVMETLAGGSADLQAVAVQVLGQLDTASASRALASLAVFGKSAAVRRSAVETLRERDPRGSVDLLISAVRKPLKYEVRRVGGANAPGILYVEGQRFNLGRYYTIPNAPNPLSFDPIAMSSDRTRAMMAYQRHLSAADPSFSGADPTSLYGLGFATTGGLPLMGVPSDATPVGSGLSGRAGSRSNVSEAQRQELALMNGVITAQNNAAEYQRTMVAAEQRLEADVAAVEAENQAAAQLNDRVIPALEAVTDQHLGANPDAWASWWADQQGYVYQAPDKPTIVQTIASPYTPTYRQSGGSMPSMHGYCFAKGTPVQTLDGPRPIETIRVGDRVLTQDPDSGKLGYEPIVRVYHNPPNRTLRVTLGRETIVATPIHHFWRAGRGWAMARDLKPGDRVRTLRGVAVVDSVEEDVVQPVFNLQTFERHSFFVGDRGAMVHDNSLLRPVSSPFDAPKESAPAVARAD